jgi:hypothetical protein
MKFHQRCRFILFAAWPAILLAGAAPPGGGQTFASPDDAVAALVSAADAHDMTALHGIFGPAWVEITSPDPAQAEDELKQFTTALDRSHELAKESETRSVLEVGDQRWPFPAPLVETGGRWFFDTAAGREEVINRRIGRNELSALQSARAYVEAQREYASHDRDGDSVLEYAPKFMSSPGQKDGLYWPEELDGELSPMGPQIAAAQAHGYLKNTAEPSTSPQPFRGYCFRILTAQGKNAPGGGYDYLINGNMIGGFALVAYPAVHGESGIMTFIVNQQGRVYQKNLGPETARLAAKMMIYDPDNTWKLSPD